MRSVDLQTVMGWNPCKDFPPDRVKELCEGHDVTADYVIGLDMRQDEKLWVLLREAFFGPDTLDAMASLFVLHVADLSGHPDPMVIDAVTNAILSSLKEFDMLPDNPNHERWKEGATDSERGAALSALWAATARARTEKDKNKRIAKLILERDWQIELVRERAENANTSAN